MFPRLSRAYFARNNLLHGIPSRAGTPMVTVALMGIIATFLTSYTRARADALGIDSKVGIMQRPERVVELAAPRALFGLALGGWVLVSIVLLPTVTAWWTAVQRILYVRRATEVVDGAASERAATPLSAAPESRAAAPAILIGE